MSAPRFEVEPLGPPGLLLLRRKTLEDRRGSFTRLFCAETFRAFGFSTSISQVNHTLTRQAGTIRGLHFQHPPHAEVKVVSCLRGSVFDVAVDLRRDSPTFLQWRSACLAPGQANTLVIPEGFAHGFQTLEADCELLYFHSAAYHPEAEAGLHPLDPRLAIAWPQPVTDLSDRDQGHPFLPSDYSGLSQ